MVPAIRSKVVPRVRCLAVTVGVVALAFVAFSPIADVAVGSPPLNAIHSSATGPRPASPDPGPCLQSSAHCGGSLALSGAVLGAVLLFVVGGFPATNLCAELVRRRRSRVGSLPAGIPILVLRPPRDCSLSI